MDWNIRNDDDLSFEDSERFEDDSQVSLDDSVDGANQNWRGWNSCPSNGEAIQPGLSCVVYQYQFQQPQSGRFSSASNKTIVQNSSNDTLLSLSEISARICAEKWSFQQLEIMYQHIIETRAQKFGIPTPPSTIPEKIFLSFIVHCFPQSTDEIRMYSTLANGTCDQFNNGNHLYQSGAVRDVSQTGFLLSANVISPASDSQSFENRASVSARGDREYHVTVKVDRCRIVECTCECSTRSSWCQHVVALSLYRIHQRNCIKFNETIADAINSMSDFELRKLVQWHINEIPRKCIPGFQYLIDKIKDPNSDVNKYDGAPDPTDGGHEPVSRFDFPEIEDKIRKLLCKFCVPTPSVHCDVQFLSANQHPTTVEWSCLIKPLRSREPEGMWNLLQMVREMCARGDENAVALLRTITDECLSNTQVLLWWYVTKLVQSGNWSQINSGKTQTSTQLIAQYNCAQMCDEIVNLWKCVATNPRASKYYRTQLAVYLEEYHRNAVSRLRGVITGIPIAEDQISRPDATILSNHQAIIVLQCIVNNNDGTHLSSQNMRFTVDMFPGFFTALQMCHYLCENHVNFGVPEDAYFDLEAPNLSVTVKMIPAVTKKNKKKKKKRSRRTARNARDDDEEDEEENNFRQMRGRWRVVHDEMRDYARELSIESGQESDVEQSTSSNAIEQRRKKLDSAEMDVNEVLAAAFSPLDIIDYRFLKCEAYATHGYRSDAIEQSTKLLDYLLENLTEQSEILREICSQEVTTSSKSDISIASSSANSQDVASCSTDSERATDGDSSVAKCNKFLQTLDKMLFVTKIMRMNPSMQLKVFWFTLKTLTVKKYPLVTKHQQMALYYMEAEFVAILQQCCMGINLGSIEMEYVRSVAHELIHTNAGNNGDIPPIPLAQFLFETLCPPQNDELQPACINNRRLQKAGDDELALHVALNLLGSSPGIPEILFPMHCEGIRRQKNEITLMMLTRFKDSHEKLGLIIDKILDPALHRMYTNHSSNAAYFLERCPTYLKYHKNKQRPIYPYRAEADQLEFVQQELPKLTIRGKQPEAVDEEASVSNVECCSQAPALVSRERFSDEGMQSSSSSETSSEIGCIAQKPGVPAFGLTKINASTLIQQRQNQYNVKNDGKIVCKKMKRRYYNQLNPMSTATEAYVHHITELAKKVLAEAGGQHNNMFALGNGAIAGTHRKLHLCSVIIGVYALGLNNRISPSWNTRTYSTSASWIAGQVQDIGPSSIEMIRETWTAHFTPSEVATISDRASPSSDPLMRKEASKLALSVLPYSHSLSDEEIISALGKCRDDSREMLINGLMAMDTQQFKQQPGGARPSSRTKPLFAAMRHWLELSAEEEAQQQYSMGQQQHANPQPQLVANPYFVHPMQQIQKAQYYQPPPHMHQGIYNSPPPPILPQQQGPQQYLHPNEQARMHQSHSAPQLGTNQTEGSAEEQQQEQQQQKYPTALMNAFKCGIKAMENMATSPGEERHMYLKYGTNPPYYDEISKLYQVSTQLGIHNLLTFFSTAGRSVASPYMLHKFAKETTKFFPYRPFLPSMNVPPPSTSTQSSHGASPSNFGIQPLMSMQHPSNFRPHHQQAASNCRYPGVKLTSPGMITNLFVQSGYHHVTGELFERTCEQYLQAIVNKLNNPRSSDTNEICGYIAAAYEAFKWVPAPMGINLFEDFVRTFKKHKTFKNVANAINAQLNSLC